MMPMVARGFAVVLALSAVSSAWAVEPADRGKKRVASLFQEVLSKHASMVVRVQAAKRDVALATVVSADGYLLTKGSEITGPVSVVLGDGSIYDAEQVAYHKLTDLALLKIDATGLTPVEFDRSSALEVGDWVAAAGRTTDPVAVGVVSVAARKLYQQQSQIENANKGVLGIRFKTDEDNGPPRIAEVLENSGAERAGLEAGDIVNRVAGRSIDSRQTLLDMLDKYKPGERVEVVVRRGEDELMMEVRLGRRTDRGTEQNNMGGTLSGRRTGFPLIVQHDMVLRPSDCGGPLVDLEGRVLGINIARAGRVETWALPSKTILPVLKQMLNGEHATRSE